MIKGCLATDFAVYACLCVNLSRHYHHHLLLHVCGEQVTELDFRSGELLRQATNCVDTTQSSLSDAVSEHSLATRYITALATDVAVIDGYNTSAHLVCPLAFHVQRICKA